MMQRSICSVAFSCTFGLSLSDMQAAGIDEAALMPGVRCLSAQSLNEGFRQVRF